MMNGKCSACILSTFCFFLETPVKMAKFIALMQNIFINNTQRVSTNSSVLVCGKIFLFDIWFALVFTNTIYGVDVMVVMETYMLLSFVFCGPKR